MLRAVLRQWQRQTREHAEGIPASRLAGRIPPICFALPPFHPACCMLTKPKGGIRICVHSLAACVLVFLAQSRPLSRQVVLKIWLAPGARAPARQGSGTRPGTQGSDPPRPPLRSPTPSGTDPCRQAPLGSPTRRGKPRSSTMRPSPTGGRPGFPANPLTCIF